MSAANRLRKAMEEGRFDGLSPLIRGDIGSALDSDRRQRAEIRNLKAEAERRLNGLTEAHWHLTSAKPDISKAVAAIARAVACQPKPLRRGKR